MSGVERMAEGISDTLLAVLAGGFSTGLWLLLQQYLQNRAALAAKRIDVLLRIKLETYGPLLTHASDYVMNPSRERYECYLSAYLRARMLAGKRLSTDLRDLNRAVQKVRRVASGFGDGVELDVLRSGEFYDAIEKVAESVREEIRALS